MKLPQSHNKSRIAWIRIPTLGPLLYLWSMYISLTEFTLWTYSIGCEGDVKVQLYQLHRWGPSVYTLWAGMVSHCLLSGVRAEAGFPSTWVLIIMTSKARQLSASEKPKVFVVSSCLGSSIWSPMYQPCDLRWATQHLPASLFLVDIEAEESKCCRNVSVNSDL